MGRQTRFRWANAAMEECSRQGEGFGPLSRLKQSSVRGADLVLGYCLRTGNSVHESALVKTCALVNIRTTQSLLRTNRAVTDLSRPVARSEERRVGKECRS